jgi:hypothetical protein
MSIRLTILFIGLAAIILPFLGIPRSVKDVVLVLLGIGLCAISYMIRKDNNTQG